MKLILKREGGFYGRLYLSTKDSKALKDYLKLIGKTEEFDCYLVKNFDIPIFDFFIPLYDFELDLAQEFVSLMENINEP